MGLSPFHKMITFQKKIKNLPFGHAATQYRLGLRIWKKKNGGLEQKVIPIILCAGFLNDLRHINRYAKPCLL